MSSTDRWNLDGSGAEPLKGDDPSRIGPIPLLGRLGAGGMGRVYLGVHEGRYVAVKQVLPSVVGEDKAFVRRFGHELDNLARLPADSTAALVLSDLAAGPPWFATAYVPGLTLRQAVAGSEGGLPGQALWLLLREVAAGLATVHELGMVHRDVKPSNVMLTVDGATLIDFGVARAADQSELTLSGMVVGTPAYMSPEQASGRKGLTSATDVFALGSVLTFAACGRPPFGDASGPAVLYRVVHEAPDTDALRVVDTELAEIVTACLDKDPEKRPTAADLLRRTEGRVPTVPPLWPAPVTEVLERRAAFATTVPEAADPPTGDSKGHTKKADAEDGARDAEEPGKAREQRRTRVLFGVMPVVVVATGATLAFQLLPYAFDPDDDATAKPSASVTVSQSAEPTGPPKPSRSASASPSVDRTEPDREPGGGGPADGGSTGSGGTAEKPPAAGGGTGFRSGATGDCIAASDTGSPYDNVYLDDCADDGARWNRQSTSDGAFRIVHRTSGKRLAASGGAMAAYCGTMKNQEWRQSPDGTLRNAANGRCLEASNACALATQECDGSAAQRWSTV